MILSLIILIPFVLVAVWLFFKISPKNVNGNIIKIYNIIVILSALTACLLISLYCYRTTGQSVDRAWWPVLSVLGSLFVFPLILFIGGIIRHFVILNITKNIEKK